MILPEITKHPIIYVDATPSSDYPVRILRAYRHNCDCKWASTGEPDALLDMMNEHCDQRAAILDEAIAILEGAKSVSGLLLDKDEERVVHFCASCYGEFEGVSHKCIEKGKQKDAITP